MRSDTITMEDELAQIARILGDALKVPEDQRSAVDLAEQAVRTMEGLVFVLQEKDEARRRRDEERLATYRDALITYAQYAHWQPRDRDGEMCDWIGGGEGPDLALRVLSGDTMAGWRPIAEDEIEEIEGVK